MMLHFVLTAVTCIAIGGGVGIATYVGRKNYEHDKLLSWLTPRRVFWCLGFAIVLFVIVFTLVMFLWYDSFGMNIYDLGNMNQAMWNTLHGHPLEMTTFFPETTRLFMHVEPIFLVLAPVYAVWQDPRMLLFLQIVILALGAIPVFGIARHLFKDYVYGLGFALLYLLNPLLHQIALTEFHPLTLGAPLALSAVYFFLKKRFSISFITFLLAMMCREDIALLLVIFSVVMLLTDRNKKFFCLLLIVSSVWVAAIFFVIYPSVSVLDGLLQLKHYASIGSSPKEIIITIFFHPLDAIKMLVRFSTLSYLFYIFTTVGFVAIFRLRYLIIGAVSFGVMAFHTFSSEILLGLGQYHAPLLFPLFLASIFGLYSYVSKQKKPVRQYIWVFIVPIIFINIFLSVRTFVLTKSMSEHRGLYSEAEVASAQQALSLIPRDASVVASWKLGVPLSGRQEFYLLPTPYRTQVDYVVMRTEPEMPCYTEQEARIDIPGLVTCEGTDMQYHDMLIELRNDESYEKIFEQNNILLFKKIAQ